MWENYPRQSNSRFLWAFFPQATMLALQRDHCAALMQPPERLRPIASGPLLAASRILLRPLVRLMIHSGITLPVLNDMLRHLFVEVAANDILTEPKTRSD